MRVISFAQIKGGVGKTALCILAARYLTALGRSVLVIDSDIQRYSTQYFHADPEVFGVKSLGKAISNKDLPANIQKGDTWDVVPADLSLLDFQCTPDNNRYKNILLPQIENQYDYVLIDVPSGLDFYARNAASVSDIIVVPVIPASYEILAGLSLIQHLSENLSIPADRYRIVLNMFEGDPSNPSKGNTELVDFLVERLGERLVDQLVGDAVPRAKDIHNALQTGSPISNTKAHRRSYDALTEVMQAITLEASSAPEKF